MPGSRTMTAKITKSDSEWRKELTPMQYAVLREKATEQRFSGEYEHEPARVPMSAPAADDAVRIRRPVRFGMRLAKLHRARGRKSYRRGARRQPRHEPNRGTMLEVQRPSRPCLQ